MYARFLNNRGVTVAFAELDPLTQEFRARARIDSTITLLRIWEREGGGPTDEPLFQAVLDPIRVGQGNEVVVTIKGLLARQKIDIPVEFMKFLQKRKSPQPKTTLWDVLRKDL